MRRSEGCKGLTLIEILVCVMMLSIITSVFISMFKKEKINTRQSQATQVEEFDPSKLQAISGANKRLKMVGSYDLGSFKPDIFIVFDSVSNYEYMIVRYIESVAVTVMPKGAP